MVALTIRNGIDTVLWIFIMGFLLWAFVDCVIRRKGMFPAIGTMPKIGWLAVIGLVSLLTLVSTSLGIFAYVGAGLAAYYLLDVRRGLREAAEGPW
ncbi:hypothetical protein Cme02nite_60260 [Catellatospora methionotrophica]|uniref:DUF2516 family protein n=1 Tax=Catellatospora methionotrophica TaxID=121620 RepID=A0A8J3LLB5_9ACTN|nr:DUF2516 family protein [Catellatospora methionotrophica]GIG17694.1 hypothetical protein Cme02nite_60260 [Catellatospora methionotrophica]